MAVAEFAYNKDTYDVTKEMLDVYNRDGGFIVKKMFAEEEIAKLKNQMEMEEFQSKAYDLPDGMGRASKMILWAHPGDDVSGMFARCERIVGTSEKILGGEVYHYHTKVMLKDAKVGGTHIWHQDYGYWYKNGVLRPDVVTAYIAIDKTCKENGALEVLVGSNRCGRIDHTLQFGQQGADEERLAQIRKHFQHTYVELESGDCLFFHSNLVHKAGQNDSDMRRWVFIMSYNRRDNDPVYKHHHPNYTPLHKVPDSAILECTNLTNLEGKEFTDPKSDQTTLAKGTEDRQGKEY